MGTLLVSLSDDSKSGWPRTGRLILAVVAGFALFLALNGLYSYLTGNLRSALAGLPISTRAMVSITTAASGAIVINTTCFWVAKVIARGRIAAIWWTCGAIATSMVVGLAMTTFVRFERMRLTLSEPEFLSLISMSLLAIAALCLIPAFIALYLPPRREARPDHTFD